VDSNRLLAAIGLTLLVFLSACGSSGGSATDPQSCTTPGCTVPQPLAIISTDPTNGATNVSLAQCPYTNGPCRGIIAMTFNQSVNIDSMNFQVLPFTRGTLRCPDPQLPGIGTYGCRVTPPTTIPSNQSVIVWFDSQGPFLPNTIYTATISSVNSSDGKPLANHTFSFTTASQ
jgi:hypothetical protein